MIDLFNEIEKIASKYGISTKKYLRNQIKEIVEDILKKTVDKYGTRVVVRGINAGTNNQYDFIKLVLKYMDIIAIQDQQLTGNYIEIDRNIKIKIDSIAQDIPDCDIFIINAPWSGGNIKAEVINKLNKRTYVLDIFYEIYNFYGIYAHRQFDSYSDEIDYSSKRIKDAMIQDEKEKNEESLLNLLGQCLCLGDFVSLNRIKKIEQERLASYKNAKAFIKDTDFLVKKIKIALLERFHKLNKKDILCNWIDSVSYDELDLLKNVKKRIQEGIFFSEAYTPTPYTRPTVRAIFFGKSLDRDKITGKFPSKKLEDSALYQLISNYGYRLETDSYIRRSLQIDEEENERIEMSTMCSAWYLKAINNILKSKDPVFIFAHTFVETHKPYLCPWADSQGGGVFFCETVDQLKEKIIISSEFADQTIDFYNELMKDTSISIYMSDHGKWGFTENRRYKDHSMHIILGITNLQIEARIEKVVSLINLDKIINLIFKISNMKDEMIFGDIEMYSDENRYYISQSDKKEELEDICSGYMGINTSKDKYIKLDCGKEYYFLKENNEIDNYIMREEFQERISYLREYLDKTRENC